MLSGMGFSVKTEKYSLSGVAEALEYYSEPTLGRRLSECLELLLALDEPLEEVFGELNAIKLHSCLTLFCCAVEIKNSLFNCKERNAITNGWHGDRLKNLSYSYHRKIKSVRL